MKSASTFLGALFVLGLTLPLHAQDSSHLTRLTTLRDVASLPRDDVGGPLFAETIWSLAPAMDQVADSGEPPTMPGWNKALRFMLELGALGSMGWWGYEQSDGNGRYALMAELPITAAAAWGVFAFPGDPSRGGDGVVQVSGQPDCSLRLLCSVSERGLSTI